MTPPHLCAVCSSVNSSSSDFWSSEYDHLEYCQETFIVLQSYKCMRKEAEEGCQLCSVLLEFPQLKRVNDENATLILRRCPGYPDRAVTLGTELHGRSCITRIFYRKVPAWWWDLPLSTTDREDASPACNHPAILDHAIDNIQLMKAWLRSCRKYHKACSSNQRKFLPTRLLDLQAYGDSPDIKLRETESLKGMLDRKGLQYPDYLALSHCWGDNKNNFFMTNTENYIERTKRILVNDLPKTFWDAVSIARRLGQRYLWIDSLCVIQGSKEDWAKEAALMADVYGNACYTLSALSSKDGTQGCRTQRSTRNSFFDLQVHHGTQSYIRLYRRPPAIWTNEYGEGAEDLEQGVVRSPLRYRAWTLQEAELSKRTIFFADRQLLWRCRELKGTTELPWVEQLPDEVFKMKPWPLCDGLQDDQTDGIFSDTRFRWYQLVEDYSLRSLTYDSDKLTALAGLARDYQHTFFGAQYVAGMWGVYIPRVPLFRLSDNPRLQNDSRQKMHAGASAIGAHCSATLLWLSVDKEARRYTEYIAPTWSWASVKGRISYDSQRIEPHGNSFDRMGVGENLSDCDFGGMQWVGMSAMAKNGDPYGAVDQEACLTLRFAHIARCSVPNRPSPSFLKDRKSERTRKDPILQRLLESLPPVEDEEEIDGEPLTIDGETVGVFFRDSADDALMFKDDVFCVRIRGEHVFSITRHMFKSQQETRDINMVMGIVVVRSWSNKLGETYKRIGLARWVSAMVFQQSRPMSLTLV